MAVIQISFLHIADSMSGKKETEIILTFKFQVVESVYICKNVQKEICKLVSIQYTKY